MIKEAVDWYKKASAVGWAPSQNSLGVMFLTGRGVDLDIPQAMTLIRDAANSNNADAIGNYTGTDLTPVFQKWHLLATVLQQSLVAKGKLPEAELTGVWSPATEAALRSFKETAGNREKGLTPHVLDQLGIAEEVSAAIREEMKARPP
jgi:TPR repeat protein